MLIDVSCHHLTSLVELSRTTYQEPDLPVSHSKSEVILAKRCVLIGEVVNGGPLPGPPQHLPVCSFDPQNKYRGDGALAEPPPAQFRGTAVPRFDGVQLICKASLILLSWKALFFFPVMNFFF